MPEFFPVQSVISLLEVDEARIIPPLLVLAGVESTLQGWRVHCRGGEYTDREMAT